MTRVPARRPRSSTPAVPARPESPDPARLARLVARVWLEVRAGRRPLAQLAPVVAPAVLRRLAAQVARPPANSEVPKVGRVVASRPHAAACEATVTITNSSGRTTALAVRLERHLGLWRVVELTAPESGLTALPTASLPDGFHRRDAFDETEEEQG